MVQYTHLRRAPIVEAVIDFRVKLPGSFDPLQLRTVRSRLKAEYPTVEEKGTFHATFQLKPAESKISTGAPKFAGLFLKSSDKRHIAQFRIDGFAFSELKPYTRWEEVREKAKDLWSIYLDTCSPLQVNRIAVRYINRMEIPEGQFEISDYMTAPPDIAPNLSFSPMMVSFFQRIVIKDHYGNNANIIQASESSDNPDTSILILDIDVYRMGEFRINGELFNILDKLREVKNEIFFGSVTDKTVELFK